jgi:hypothetical protein
MAVAGRFMNHGGTEPVDHRLIVEVLPVRCTSVKIVDTLQVRLDVVVGPAGPDPRQADDVKL